MRRLDFLNKIYTANVLTCTSFDGVTAGPAEVFWLGFLFMAIGFVSYVFREEQEAASGRGSWYICARENLI